MLTLVALFIPAFDSFSRRQAPMNNAQIINEGLSRAKSYALAPPAILSTDSSNHQFIVLKLAYSTDKIQSYYAILTAPANEEGLPDVDSSTYRELQSPRYLPSNEVALAQPQSDPLNAVVDFAAEKAVHIYFRVGSNDTYLLTRQGSENIITSGYEEADYKITLFLLPNNQGTVKFDGGTINHMFDGCKTDLPCAKIDINPLSASAQISVYTQ